MSRRHLLVGPALFTAFLLAACDVEPPTGIAPSLEISAAKQPGTCVFMTPNGKTHSVPAASGKCPSPKPAAQIAGTYELTRFTFRQLEWTEDGETREISELYDVADWLGEGGAVFELTLNPDGTTAGRFYVPPTPGEEGSGIDVDLAGSWRLDGDTVAIDITADALFDLLPYTFADGRLTAGPGTVGDADDPLFIEEVILTRR